MDQTSKTRPTDLSLQNSVSSGGAFQAPRFPLAYLFSFCIIVLITGFGLLIRELITPTNLVMPYLLGVVSIAVFWGRGPAVFASVLGVIAFDIFLVPPYLSFVVEDTEYVITFLSLFVVGIVISNLTARIKDQVLEAREREARVTSLYHLSQELAVAYSLSDVLAAIAANIRTALKQDVWIFLAGEGGKDAQRPVFNAFPPAAEQNRSASEAVLAAFRTGTPSGFGTETFPETDTINFPLTTKSGTIGVISIAGGGVEQSSASDRLQVYEAFANLSALAIERVYLNKEASQAQLLKAKEELQSAILNSISHDFRTPLVTITGTLSSLDSEIDMLDTNAQKNLVQQALTEAEKLNRLVGNLLNISRLESGAVHLQLEPVDLQDLIGATLEQMKHRAGRQINIRIPDDLPLISADYVLLQQALMNVIENAIKYSPENTPVDIEVHIERKSVSIGIADRGPGIEEKEISRVFNKFYRINNNPEVGGTGLGLAIVKGIIDAHEASIEVFRREGGGMVFQIAFPYAEFQPAE